MGQKLRNLTVSVQMKGLQVVRLVAEPPLQKAMTKCFGTGFVKADPDDLHVVIQGVAKIETWQLMEESRASVYLEISQRKRLNSS